MSDKREFFHGYSPVMSLPVCVYIDIDYGRKKLSEIPNRDKKETDIWRFYLLFHTRVIAPNMKSPISAVTGESGIDDGLFCRTGDKETGAPSRMVT